MPRFVLLEHDHPIVHWDLMLEVDAVLWTWRLERNPCLETDCQATRIADHRRLYLDYEGPIGGNRGTVKRLIQGEYAWLENSTSRIVIGLEGSESSGRWTFEKAEGERWIMQR